MIHWLYERQLKKQLELLPSHICIMIDDRDMMEVPDKISEVAKWCQEIGIKKVTFHISTADPEILAPYLHEIMTIGSFARLSLYFKDTLTVNGEGLVVEVAIGKSGREEITQSIREMAKMGIQPENVNGKIIEEYLTFKCEPDLVIKTGGAHLTDFLIWQSVYSELFFSDVNWKFFRKTDFLRALRDFQFRRRRFGR